MAHPYRFLWLPLLASIIVACQSTDSWVVSRAASTTPAASRPADPFPSRAVTVDVDAAKVISHIAPRRLGSSNVAEWNDVAAFRSPQVRQWLADLKMAYLRLPGGSWANVVYWNGHGVRGPDGKVDPTKVGPDGYPAVDYSDYAPSFNVDANTLHPSTGYHGNVDVKTLHEFVMAMPGCSALPCLNAGTGRPIDAAEWVRWANQKMAYHASVWEIGNELGGSWEPGNYLPGTKVPITDKIYTQRFNAIASAMRTVQKDVKIGGCAFVEAMLRDCGDNVDFASIHAYPGSASQSVQEMLSANGETVAREVAQVRGFVDQYQPQRAAKIEIAYTEWNLAGGLTSADLFSGLWATTFLAEMASNKVDFATHWDCFTHTRPMPGGHGMIWGDGEHWVRKAQYYALWLWNNYMQEDFIAAINDGSPFVYSYASRSADVLCLVLINSDPDRPADVTVRLAGFTPAATGEQALLTHRQYHWNPETHVPEWSQSPRVERLATGPTFAVKLPPFSLSYIRVPSAAKPALSEFVAHAPPTPPAGSPILRLIVPKVVFAGDKVEGWVQAWEPEGKEAYPVALAPAALSAQGAATFDRPTARLDEALGRFIFTAPTPGPLTLMANSGAATTKNDLVVKASQPHAQLLWDFQKPQATDTAVFKSGWPLASDPTLRPNHNVARVDLPAAGALPTERLRTLLSIVKFPGENVLDRGNIRGVFFDLMTRNLATEDPNASISIIMQSPANYWMVLGGVPLKNTKEWQRQQVDVSNEKLLQAMPSAYCLWFVLQSSKPVSGSVCFDNIGFMVR